MVAYPDGTELLGITYESAVIRQKSAFERNVNA